MKKMVLLLGHGSRNLDSQAQFHRLVELVQARLNFMEVQPGFLELCEPSVGQGIRRCVESGAQKILAIPVFLSGARHVKEDLPQELQQALHQPGPVRLTYGNPLGVGGPVPGILLERLWQTTTPQELASAALLLIGRGSPDLAAVRDLEWLRDRLKETLKAHAFTTGFVDRSHPSVPEALEHCRAVGSRSILILPCVLFPGIVMDRIYQAVQEFETRHPKLPVKVAPPMGPHPKLADLILDRIRQSDETPESISAPYSP